VNLLERYSKAGGVVDYVLLEYSGGSIEQIHHDAVIAALRIIQRRNDREAERTSEKHGIPRSQIFSLNA